MDLSRLHGLLQPLRSPSLLGHLFWPHSMCFLAYLGLFSLQHSDLLMSPGAQSTSVCLCRGPFPYSTSQTILQLYSVSISFSVIQHLGLAVLGVQVPVSRVLWLPKFCCLPAWVTDASPLKGFLIIWIKVLSVLIEAVMSSLNSHLSLASEVVSVPLLDLAHPCYYRIISSKIHEPIPGINSQHSASLMQLKSQCCPHIEHTHNWQHTKTHGQR